MLDEQKSHFCAQGMHLPFINLVQGVDPHGLYLRGAYHSLSLPCATATWSLDHKSWLVLASDVIFSAYFLVFAEAVHGLRARLGDGEEMVGVE